MQTTYRRYLLGAVVTIVTLLLLSHFVRAEVSFSFLGFHYESSSSSNENPELALTIQQKEPVLQGTWTAKIISKRPTAKSSIWFPIIIIDSNNRNTFSVNPSS